MTKRKKKDLTQLIITVDFMLPIIFIHLFVYRNSAGSKTI